MLSWATFHSDVPTEWLPLSFSFRRSRVQVSAPRPDVPSFPWFFSVPQKCVDITLKPATAASLHRLSSSWSTYHTTIRRFITQAVEIVSLNETVMKQPHFYLLLLLPNAFVNIFFECLLSIMPATLHTAGRTSRHFPRLGPWLLTGTRNENVNLTEIPWLIG